MKKKWSKLVLTTLIFSTMIACKKSDSTPSTIIDGTWFIIQDSTVSTPISGGDTKKEVYYYNKANFYKDGARVTFNNGLTYDSSYHTSNNVTYTHADTSRYAVSGNTLTILPYKNNSDIGRQFNISVNENILTLYYTSLDTIYNYSTSPKIIQSISNSKNWILFSR